MLDFGQERRRRRVLRVSSFWFQVSSSFSVTTPKAAEPSVEFQDFVTLISQKRRKARVKALHAFNSLREFNCSRATFNALWAFNSALHVQKFFQSPMADILQITFKIKQKNDKVAGSCKPELSEL